MSIEAREKAATTCPTCGGPAKKTYSTILIGGVNRGFNNSQPVKEEQHVGWESTALAQLRDREEKLEALKEAGVTDYSKPPWGFNNRVDCHFCPSSWRADRPPEHKANCPLDRILKGATDANHRVDGRH